MGRIFLNYQRAESQWAMGRIYDWLIRELGEEEVFMDFSGIPVASDFRDHLTIELNRCDLLVAGICDRWIDILQQRQGSEDHVRMEIEMAMTRGLPVLPLLPGNVAMPKSTQLPESVDKLAGLIR